MAQRSVLEVIINTKKRGKGPEDTRKDLTKLLKIMGLVSTAGIAMKQAFDFAKEGAELERTREKFDRLARSIGTTGDVLRRRLKSQTSGLISDFELMASVSDLMALGLAKNQDEAVRLGNVAGQLGFDMNQLVLTLTNMTTMRFDALGVSVDGFDEKVKALEETGLSASEAFKEAFLQQAEEQLDKVGSVADSTLGGFQRLEAGVKSFFDTIKAGVGGSEEVEKTINVLNFAIEKLNENSGVASDTIDFLLNPSIADAGAIFQNWGKSIVDNAVAQKQFKKAIEALNPVIMEEAESADRVLGILKETRDTIEDGPDLVEIDFKADINQALTQISNFANGVTQRLLEEGWVWNGQRWVIQIGVSGSLPTLGGGSTGQGGGNTVRPSRNTGRSTGGGGGYLADNAAGGSYLLPGSGSGERPYMVSAQPGELMTITPRHEVNDNRQYNISMMGAPSENPVDALVRGLRRI